MNKGPIFLTQHSWRFVLLKKRTMFKVKKESFSKIQGHVVERSLIFKIVVNSIAKKISQIKKQFLERNVPMFERNEQNWTLVNKA